MGRMDKGRKSQSEWTEQKEEKEQQTDENINQGERATHDIEAISDAGRDLTENASDRVDSDAAESIQEVMNEARDEGSEELEKIHEKGEEIEGEMTEMSNRIGEGTETAENDIQTLETLVNSLQSDAKGSLENIVNNAMQESTESRDFLKQTQDDIDQKTRELEENMEKQRQRSQENLKKRFEF